MYITQNIYLLRGLTIYIYIYKILLQKRIRLTKYTWRIARVPNVDRMGYYRVAWDECVCRFWERYSYRPKDEIKSPPFCSQHFQIHILVSGLLNYVQ